jgi:hypothetical protein
MQVVMQRHRLYISCHVARDANAIITYQTKHKIIDNDMV